jgi:hypothetical protein
MIKEILEAKRTPHISSGKFSISKIGTCWRRVYMEMKGKYREEYTENAIRIFRVGDIIHQEVIRELISKGESRKLRVVAAEVDVPSHPHISGRVDCILSDGTQNHILDIKSAGSWSMKKLKEGEVAENYKSQVLLYEHLTGIHSGYLLFVGKDKNEIEEVFVPYDKPKAEELIRQIVDFMENFVYKDREPEKCNNTPFPCGCCSGNWEPKE